MDESLNKKFRSILDERFHRWPYLDHHIASVRKVVNEMILRRLIAEVYIPSRRIVFGKGNFATVVLFNVNETECTSAVTSILEKSDPRVPTDFLRAKCPVSSATANITDRPRTWDRGGQAFHRSGCRLRSIDPVTEESFFIFSSAVFVMSQCKTDPTKRHGDEPPANQAQRHRVFGLLLITDRTFV